MNYKLNHNLHNAGLVRAIVVAATTLVLSLQPSNATQADDTRIAFVSKTAGPTPFIKNLNFQVNPIANIKSVQFTIQPKVGSVTRPISATYSSTYLSSRGYLRTDGSMKIPVFGLYDGFTNSVTLKYVFRDDSSKRRVFSVVAPAFRDPCHYNQRIEVLPRTASTRLSYDFMLLKNGCGENSPTVMDTDGARRWVGSAGASTSAFIDNAIYIAYGTQLLRIELDGAVSLVADYNNMGVLYFHHNMDPGKFGLLVEVDTRTDKESIIMELGLNGHVLKQWNMALSIASAMRAGGDDPSGFVWRGHDWFHANAATYRASDNSVIISSRENFVIALDWSTGVIKWILGDPTKAWYQYPSLRAYALNVRSGGLAPIGQHAVSITYNDKLLLFDNGLHSWYHNPPGNNRHYAAPRKYSLDLTNHAATEIYRYTRSIVSDICSSVYEDAPDNYLVDYAIAGGFQSRNAFAEIVGLQPDGARVFDYKFATNACEEIFNAIPVHFERLTMNIATVQSLVDDFTSASIDTTKWTTFANSGYSLSNVSGQLKIAGSAGAAGYAAITSLNTYSATSSQIVVDLGPLGKVGPAGHTYPWFWMKLKDQSGTGNSVEVSVNNGFLHAKRYIGGSWSDTSVTWITTMMKYLKIKEAAGTTYFQYSQDNSTYIDVIAGGLTNPMLMTQVKVEIGAGQWGTDNIGNVFLNGVNP